MEITNERLLQGARNLKAKGYTPEQVDSWLQTKGSSLGAIKSFVNTSKLQPLTDEQRAKPQGTNWGEVALAGANGVGQGIISGLGRIASGATFGASDWVDRKTGGNLARLDSDLQSSADDAGLGFANKAAKFTADVGGNIKGAGGKLATKIADKGYKGLKAFLLNSGIGGGAFGATSSDKLSDLPKNTIAGATLGSLFGGGMYGTGKLGQYAYNVAKPYANAPINAVENAVNKVGLGKLKDLVQRASQKGRGALEVADDDVIALAQEARQKSPQAYRNFEKAVDAFNDGQAERNGAVINEAFGSKGKYENIDDLVETARKQAQPYYDKLQNTGDLAPTKEQLAKQNFKRWFEGSKVVDENGQPLKLYHGTDADFDAFDMSKGRSTMDIQGAFFSPYDIDAKGYGQNLKEVYLNVKNPADEATAYKALRKYQGQNDAGLKAKQDLQRQGFDGVFNGYDEYIAFEPNQIKSVNNSGAWSSSPSLSDAGWNPKTNDALANYVKENPFLQQEIGKIRKNPLFQTEYKMSELPDTDWRILDQVNKNINDQISTAVRNGEKETVRLLERQKYDLLNKVDEIVPEYKIARGIYEAENKALKAQKIGENSLFDNNTSADKLKRTMKDMTDYEKASLKIGAREKLLNAVEGRENQTLGLKKLNNKQTQNKLKLVLGDKADDFINYAEDEVQAMRNLNKLTGNSNTSEKQNLRDKVNLLARIFKNPTGVVGEVGEALTSRIDNASNDLLSQMLLEQGGGRLNNAINDYVARATRAEQMRRLFAPTSAVLSNEVLQIK